MPFVGRPMELIMPHSSSATRGGGLPMRYSRDTVFATSAPSRLMSTTCAMSVENAPEPASHDLLHRHLARDSIFPPERFHQLHQPIRTAGVERIRLLRRDEAQQNRLDVFHRTCAVAIEHANDLAHFAEEIVGHDELRRARG